MDKIDWKRKLCSRKFWVAITGLVSGLILAFGGDKELAETVCGCIMSVASVIAYTIGEGLADLRSNAPMYVTNNGTDAIETWTGAEDEDVR